MQPGGGPQHANATRTRTFKTQHAQSTQPPNDGDALLQPGDDDEESQTLDQAGDEKIIKCWPNWVI